MGYFATHGKDVSRLSLLSVQTVGLNEYGVASIVVNPFAMQKNLCFILYSAHLGAEYRLRGSGLSTTDSTGEKNDRSQYTEKNSKAENEQWRERSSWN